MLNQILINGRGSGKFTLFADYVKLELENNNSVIIHLNSTVYIQELRERKQLEFNFHPLTDDEGKIQRHIYKLIRLSDDDLKYKRYKIAVICPNSEVFEGFLKQFCFEKSDREIYYPVKRIVDTRGFRFKSFVFIPSDYEAVNPYDLVDTVRMCLQ